MAIWKGNNPILRGPTITMVTIHLQVLGCSKYGMWVGFVMPGFIAVRIQEHFGSAWWNSVSIKFLLGARISWASVGLKDQTSPCFSGSLNLEGTHLCKKHVRPTVDAQNPELYPLIWWISLLSGSMLCWYHPRLLVEFAFNLRLPQAPPFYRPPGDDAVRGRSQSEWHLCVACQHADLALTGEESCDGWSVAVILFLIHLFICHSYRI